MTETQEKEGSVAPVTVEEINDAIDLFVRIKQEMFQGLADVGPLDIDDEDSAFASVIETREKMNEMILFLKEKVDEISGD